MRGRPSAMPSSGFLIFDQRDSISRWSRSSSARSASKRARPPRSRGSRRGRAIVSAFRAASRCVGGRPATSRGDRRTPPSYRKGSGARSFSSQCDRAAPQRSHAGSCDAIGDHHVALRRAGKYRVEGEARDERELRGSRVVQDARLALVDHGDFANTVARRIALCDLDVDLLAEGERAQESEVRVAVRDDHGVSAHARRRGAAHVRGAESQRAIARGIEDIELDAASRHGEARDGPHVGPRPGAARGAAVARLRPRRGDEVLREIRLQVDPAGGGDLPRTEHHQRQRREAQLHAALLAGTARPTAATIPALASAMRPRRSCNVADVSVCGISPLQPCGVLAFTKAVFAAPLGLETDTSTATRLVYALTRWCSSATFTTCGRMDVGSAPRVISSMRLAILALAQRAPTPFASPSREGVSATLQGWLPRVPDTVMACAKCAAEADTTMGSPR